ncbi:ATP-binding protein [Curtobacterium albidum]|uniref:ATP-binding protein n=1 Tax=Curtobacterium citreum TaxID=2036 RepID=UPI002026B569|nr:ATP-binding protein [Curtobacterium albidum]MCL9666295.1 ATP-binding protein [Curtobacterium albidum]
MNVDVVPFTFSWAALRLLGSGLYSNPWSALSELVANGFDASATTVWVDVDARDKAHSVIDIFDDGTGMDRAGIDTYAKVGHNKRDVANSSDEMNRLMGRKGIGKLAALYLSERFYLRTRNNGSDTSWILEAGAGTDPEEHPHLTPVGDLPRSENLDYWEKLQRGTFLRLLDVDLSGNGDKAIEAFSMRLANQFSFAEEHDNRSILVRVRRGDALDEYRPAAKVIAFRNLAFAEASPATLMPIPAELLHVGTLEIPAKLPSGTYVHTREQATMPTKSLDAKFNTADIPELDKENGTYRGVPYSLEGWIGIHATIDREPAQRNDPRFARNRYYNPAQLRLYVHGKLASDRLLAQLGITGTYLNYIEGEIRFEILDDDRLKDIATSNRQDFDETDPRVMVLRALVRPVVRRLMNRRQALAAKITEAEKAHEREVNARGKQAFAAQLTQDLEHFDSIPDATKHELHAVVTNKLEGDARPKTKYSVFLSHSSSDAAFANLIYFLLVHQGASDDEIFYTSKPNDVRQYNNYDALSEVVKKSISDANTLICYLTSKNFRGSEYCLFEGGAGWATRSVAQYLKLNVEYSAIPAFLTNGKVEFALLDKNGTISLRPDVYSYLVESILNPLLRHLNVGRSIAGTEELSLFDAVTYPPPLELKQEGKTEADFYDPVIVSHWNGYVQDSLGEYLENYLGSEAQK